MSVRLGSANDARSRNRDQETGTASFPPFHLPSEASRRWALDALARTRDWRSSPSGFRIAFSLLVHTAALAAALLFVQNQPRELASPGEGAVEVVFEPAPGPAQSAAAPAPVPDKPEPAPDVERTPAQVPDQPPPPAPEPAPSPPPEPAMTQPAEPPLPEPTPAQPEPAPSQAASSPAVVETTPAQAPESPSPPPEPTPAQHEPAQNQAASPAVVETSPPQAPEQPPPAVPTSIAPSSPAPTPAAPPQPEPPARQQAEPALASPPAKPATREHAPSPPHVASRAAGVPRARTPVADPPRASRLAPGSPAREGAPVAITPPRPVAGMATDRPPTYPDLARRRGEQGRVLVRVSVGPDGTPLAVAVGQSSGHTSLDNAALLAVRQWRFVPATQAGRPVPAVAEVPIQFRLET